MIRFAFVAGMIFVAVALGCSNPRPGVEIVPVEGRVTFADGKVPGPGRLRFLPLSATGGGASRPSRPGSAIFSADGTFRATSWEPGDGLVPGNYAVVVECWQTPPTMDGPPAVSHVPPAYHAAETTPLKLEVPADQKPLWAELAIQAAK